MARVMLLGDTAKWKRGDSGLVQIRADGEPAVCGFAVAVPHYLTHLDYPDAAYTLPDCVARGGEPSLPIEVLARAAASLRSGIDKQVAGCEHVADDRTRQATAGRRRLACFTSLADGATRPRRSGPRRRARRRRHE